MFAPRPPRNVLRTSVGRCLRRVSRRSRSTKSVPPWLGYWGASCSRAQSRSTRSRIPILPPSGAPRARVSPSTLFLAPGAARTCDLGQLPVRIVGGPNNLALHLLAAAQRAGGGGPRAAGRRRTD